MLSTLLTGIDPGVSVKSSIAIGLIFFISIVLVIFRPSQRHTADRAGQLPLEDD